MRQIIKNQYIEEFCFNSSLEQTSFVSKVNVNHKLSLDGTYGDYYYCYTFCDSLTQEKNFTLSFSNDTDKEYITIFLWDKRDIIIVSFDSSIFFIDLSVFRVIKELDISTPLIGFYQINEAKMLILEEGYIRIANDSGEIIQDKNTDLIEYFSIDNNVLLIQTNKSESMLKLI